MPTITADDGSKWEIEPVPGSVYGDTGTQAYRVEPVEKTETTESTPERKVPCRICGYYSSDVLVDGRCVTCVTTVSTTVDSLIEQLEDIILDTAGWGTMSEEGIARRVHIPLQSIINQLKND